MIFTRYATLIFSILSLATYTEYLHSINLLCGDIETNPGPFNRWKFISFYQCNLNGLLAHNREKCHAVEAFVISNNIFIFCISGTFLDSSVDNIYDGLNINDYTLFQRNYPSNTNHGGVAIYYKDHLPVISRNGTSSLHEGIVLDIRLANNNCFLTSLYRSPSQARTNLVNFVQDLTCSSQILMTKSH